jgi:chemotaxis protein methyltransferase CheR
MKLATFERFRQIVYQQSGIDLSAGKEALVRGRLGKRMRALGLADEQDYLDYVLGDASGDEMVQLLDAISTNFTQFFREPDHFALLADLLKRWLGRDGQRSFRIWSAACSSGEEPYSIGIASTDAIEEYGASGVDLRILATDISTRVLDRARCGRYSEQAILAAPQPLRRYFNRSAQDEGDDYEVCDSIRDLVTFRRMNLSRPPFPMKGPFDLVFCRNVMIYFDNAVRNRLLAEIERLLRPGGYLFVGHTESLAALDTRLRPIKPSVYRKEA